jgi:hypothetical protein
MSAGSSAVLMCWVNTILVRLWPGWLNANSEGNANQSAGQSCHAPTSTPICAGSGGTGINANKTEILRRSRAWRGRSHQAACRQRRPGGAKGGRRRRREARRDESTARWRQLHPENRQVSRFTTSVSTPRRRARCKSFSSTVRPSPSVPARAYVAQPTIIADIEPTKIGCHPVTMVPVGQFEKPMDGRL